MLSGVVDFLFGTTAAQLPDESKEVKLKTHITDHDWVVVDKLDEDLDDQQPEDAENLDFNLINPRQPLSGQRSPTPDAALHFHDPYSARPEESWIIDPPPCFNQNRQQLQQPVVMSPIENLLIEHPSMSVFISATQTPNTVEGNNFVNVEIQSVEENQPTYTSQAHAVAQYILPPDKVLRLAQKQQHYEETRGLTKKHFDRNNKTLHFLSKGKRQRQRNRVQFPAGCINSRKGQRKN